LTHHTPHSAAAWPASDIAVLLALARELGVAQQRGVEQPQLRGKHLALCFEPDDTRTRNLVAQAAREQGARVSVVQAALEPAASADVAAHTARVLGRLYDAIVCGHNDARWLQALAEHAQVPVLAVLDAPGHPLPMITSALQAEALWPTARPTSKPTPKRLQTTDSVSDSGTHATHRLQAVKAMLLSVLV
jgi:ornithine carbamoyltransferase